jgi:hypothetical protein
MRTSGNDRGAARSARLARLGRLARPARVAGRTWLARLAVLALCAAAAFIAGRFLAYTQFYTHTRFRPASAGPGEPTCYYLDWREPRREGDVFAAALGEDGVFRGSRDRTIDGRLRHDPLRVIQESLALHDQLLERPDPGRANVLRRQLEWLTHEGLAWLDGRYPVWPHWYGFERYGLSGPWVSALTQGQAVSLLVRGAIYFDEPRYGQLAAAAAAALRREDLPFAGGDETGRFLEEFPSVPPSHALNGCLFAWLGLWDLARYEGDAAQRADCVQRLQEISRRVPRFESGDWTRYDALQRRPTSPAYQELHAALAEAIAVESGDGQWALRAASWGHAARRPWRRARIGLEVALAKARDAIAGVPHVRGRAPAPQALESGLESGLEPGQESAGRDELPAGPRQETETHTSWMP